MILYLDTSALVKLYVQENHSELVLQAVHCAEAVASHWLAYVETYAALGRLSREGVISMTQLEKLEQRFEIDWNNYLRIEIMESNLRRAGQLVQNFGLRTYDSVHLAAAEFLFVQSGEIVNFACFDKRLNN